MRTQNVLFSLYFEPSMTTNQLKKYMESLAVEIASYGPLTLEETEDLELIIRSSLNTISSVRNSSTQYGFSWLGLKSVDDINAADPIFISKFCKVVHGRDSRFGDEGQGSARDGLILPAIVLADDKASIFESNKIYSLIREQFEPYAFNQTSGVFRIEPDTEFRILTPVYVELDSASSAKVKNLRSSSRDFELRKNSERRPSGKSFGYRRRPKSGKLSPTYTYVEVLGYSPTLGNEFVVLDKWWETGHIDDDTIFDRNFPAPVKGAFWQITNAPEDNRDYLILVARNIHSVTSKRAPLIVVYLNRKLRQKAVFTYDAQDFILDEFSSRDAEDRRIEVRRLYRSYGPVDDFSSKEVLDEAYAAYSFLQEQLERPRFISGVGTYALESDRKRERKQMSDRGFRQGLRVRKR